MTTLDASSGGDAAVDADGFVLAAKDEAASPSRAAPRARGVGPDLIAGASPPGASPASSSRALVVSRFFARPASASAAAEEMMPSLGPRGKRVAVPARLVDAVAQARVALAQFVEVARKKSAHDAHEDAAEAVLIPFRPFARARVAALSAAKDGDVLFVDEGAAEGGARAELDAGPAPSAPPPGASGSPDEDDDPPRPALPGPAPPPASAGGGVPLPPAALVVSTSASYPPGASDAGAVLAGALAELDRLHVNASCRVRQRAPEVAAARARLTALRRECRDARRAIDPRGHARDAERKRRAKTRLPAARDAAVFSFARGDAPRTVAELRARCPTFRERGSPHHLCPHLCYYREYDPARQMFVLRVRAAAALGTAAALDDWRAELEVATAPPREGDDEGDDAAAEASAAEARGGKKRIRRGGGAAKRRRAGKDGAGARAEDPEARARAEDDDDARSDFDANDSDSDSDSDDGVEGEDGGVGKKRRGPVGRKKRKKTRALASGGWLAAKSLPWRVVFVSPGGARFERGEDVLAVLGVDDRAAGPAAANFAGGGGLGNETLDDFDWTPPSPPPLVRTAASPPPRRGGRAPHPRALGRVAPAPRRLAPSLGGARGTHGGSGVRLARPEERGLDEATDLLRAALWPRDADAAMLNLDASSSGGRREEEGGADDDPDAPRSPLRLAPDPFEDERERIERTERIERARDDEATRASRDVGDELVDGVASAAAAASPSSPRAAAAGAASLPPATPTRRWWAPPRSPFGLLEEILWEDEWKLLVACMMLNCTTRLQVDRVLWRLFLLAPTPEAAAALGADPGAPGVRPSGVERVERVVAPLGLHRKRAKAFVRLSEEYAEAKKMTTRASERATSDERDVAATSGSPSSRNGPPPAGLGPVRVSAPVASLHGVGAYASDAHAMFCEGLLHVAPRDHALRWWYAWAVERREEARREGAEERRRRREEEEEEGGMEGGSGL